MPKNIRPERENEFYPIERRSIPRAPNPGLVVVGVDSSVLLSKRFPVVDFSLESLFLPGDDVMACEPGEQYRIRLEYDEQIVECTTKCIRKERRPRRGVVLRLVHDQKGATELLKGVLKPAAVP